MSTLAKAGYLWRSAFQGVRVAPFVHLVAVLTIAIALFSAGLLRGGLGIVESLLGALGGEVRVTIYLADEAGAEEATALAASLRERGATGLRVVSPQAALRRLADELGEQGRVLASLPTSPLPYTLELEVPEAERHAGALTRFAEELEGRPEVVEVAYGKEALDRLSGIALAVRYGGLVASIVGAIATIVIVSATLQLAIHGRRQEIEIQKLVGATNAFVRLPFLLEGLLQGLLGAALATLALLAFGELAAPQLARIFAFLIGPGGQPRLLEPLLALQLLAVGGLLGLGGSVVAVRRFLKV